MSPEPYYENMTDWCVVKAMVNVRVRNCKECPHSTNNAIEHNCPFTPTPSNIYWWCKVTGRDIVDPYEIEGSCPLRFVTEH